MLYALSKPISIRPRDDTPARKDLTTNWSLVVSEFKYDKEESTEGESPRTLRLFPHHDGAYKFHSDFPLTQELGCCHCWLLENSNSIKELKCQ